MTLRGSRSQNTARAPRTASRTHADLYRRLIPHQFLDLLGKHSLRQLRLGDAAERNMTILFSDIRDFTTLSESMTPRENFRFINAYLSRMEPALFRRHGFIDKTIGDAIMAIFPGKADDALQAALDMLVRLREFNAARRGPKIPPLRIGIGLNTGVAMVGAIGGTQRIETTVISDTVNVASRFESLTKTYGVPLLISEHTLYSLADPTAYDIRFVDRVRVKGKEQPQSVYEVFDTDPPRMRLAKRRTRRMFEEALAHYHFREIGKARTLLRRCLAACPGDSVARVYAERCARYTKTGVHEGTGEAGRALAWSEGYLLGQRLLDDQHRNLFAQVNRFVRSVRRLRDSGPIHRLSAFLRRYVDEHFETEERMMRQARYPLLAVQQQQHARFVRDLAFLEAELRDKLATERIFMLFKLQLLLVDWTANHTAKLDRHFGRFLNRARQRARGGRP